MKLNRHFYLLLLFVLQLNFLGAQNPKAKQWKEDLDHLVRYFPANDRSLVPTQAYLFDEEGIQLQYFQLANKLDLFFKKADELREEIPNLKDNEIIVRMANLVALADNAHSRVYLLRNRTVLSSLAIRTYWFADGLYVIRALESTKEALGAKIIAINGTKVEDLIEKVDALYGGNDSWKKYKRIYYLNSPDILEGLGIIENTDEVELTLRSSDGKEFRMKIPALPLVKNKTPREVNRDLSPFHQQEEQNWLNILPKTKEDLPLFLHFPEKAYWYQYQEKSDILYFQHNRVQNEKEKNFETFANEMIAELKQRTPGKFVIDLRFNTGGDLTITLPYWKKLAEQLPSETKVFVLTTYHTFSAAISSVVHYRRLLDAQIIGEPVGDDLTNWSEGGRFYLPNSGLEIKYANGFHDMTFFPRPDLGKIMSDPEFRKKYEQKITQTQVLSLDKEIKMSFQDYMEKKDVLLEYVKNL